MSLALASGFFTTSATCEASPLPNKTSKQTKIKMKWIFFSDDFFFQLHIKCDLTTFSPCLPLVFSFSEWCFAEQKFLLLIEFNLIRVFFFFFFSVMDYALGVTQKNFLLNFGSCRLFSYYFFKKLCHAMFYLQIYDLFRTSKK